MAQFNHVGSAGPDNGPHTWRTLFASTLAIAIALCPLDAASAQKLRKRKLPSYGCFQLQTSQGDTLPDEFFAAPVLLDSALSTDERFHAAGEQSGFPLRSLRYDPDSAWRTQIVLNSAKPLFDAVRSYWYPRDPDSVVMMRVGNADGQEVRVQHFGDSLHGQFIFASVVIVTKPFRMGRVSGFRIPCPA